MDAPPSRYRVVEKEGRLIVLDTATGASTGTAPASPAGSATAPMAAGRGLIDALADATAGLAAKGRDAEGRLVIAWEWTKNGKTRRWDAALDTEQQRRLGRAILAIVVPIPLATVTFVVEQPLIGLIIGVPLILFGALALNRLQTETEA